MTLGFGELSHAAYRHAATDLTGTRPCAPRSGCIAGPAGATDGTIVLGFDDGQVYEFLHSDLRQAAAAGNVTYDSYTNADGKGFGLVEGERGFASAAAFSMYKGKPAALLVGRVDDLFAAPMYLAHHPLPAEPKQRETPRRSAAGGDAGTTERDRLGMYTFVSGDVVRYTAGEVAAEAVEAVVIGLVHRPKEGKVQARKYLILAEAETDCMLVASFGQWRRVSIDSTGDLHACLYAYS